MVAERAVEARREADKLACEAWTKRMLAFKGPAQPSPTLGDALNAGYLYLEVRCLGWPRIRPSPSTSCAAEGHADPRAGALHAMQGPLRDARLSVQAQPSGGASAHQDFGE
jgi:hypothetical protein